MSGQPAEQPEGSPSADSRLDAILNQLNALGASTPAQQEVAPRLRSVPDLPAPVFEQPADGGHEEAPQASERLSPPDVPPPPASLAVVPNPEPAVAPPPLPPLPEIEPIAEPTTFAFGRTDEISEPTETQELVFELNGALEEEPILNHEIFHVAEASVDAPMAEAAPTTPSLEPPVGDTGWVSHHTEMNHGTIAEAAISQPIDTASETPNGGFSGAEAIAGPASFESPEWGDIVEKDDVVEDVPFSAFNRPASGEAGSSEYTTDEELPIPDFTGVWDDAGIPDVWDADTSLAAAVPDPVEIPGRGSGISVGHNELDSLRPDEEEKAAKEPTQNLGRKMQLFAVILFGLIALAVVLLNDPAAVDELRRIYDGFFG